MPATPFGRNNSARKAQFTLSIISNPNILRENIEVFEAWLANHGSDWTVGALVSVYKGHEALMLGGRSGRPASILC